MSHQLHLILQHDGFGIEESKASSWRLIKSKLISAAEGRRILDMMAKCNRRQLSTYLSSQGFQPWFDVTPPVNTNPRPIVIETRSLDLDNE